MPRISYKRKKFGPEALAVIAQATAICEEYAAQGFDLTLRQLYYQFVARDLIANTDRDYKRLGSIINDARLAGRLDWDYIVDRTRNLRDLAHWRSPAELVRAASRQYREDVWAKQDVRIEVWIEKDALIGVIAGVCEENDVPYFSCRGYVSQSEAWAASQRLIGYMTGEREQRVVILHLGDHDPSGLDMTRDIDERLYTFVVNDYYRDHLERTGDSEADAKAATEWANERLIVRRIALTWEQIRQYGPPPNPAKVTDSRAAGYIAEHGNESWELDALEPTVLAALISAEIEEERDEDAWVEATAGESMRRRVLEQASKRWQDVAAFLAEPAAE